MSITYLAILTYVRPVEELDAHLDGHRDWLKQGIAAGTILAAGRRVPRTGGVIFARGESLEAVEALIAADPFHRHGLATAEIIPFETTLAADTLQGLL
ncbi:YciI family protein [Sphingomonas sanxanigenens]|uniref:YCII-related domain-containing protein n=1 Tax=Sphingomonas sanxanigenens DSM 19645 = NX02 TaxID=1123269 RepID=W0AJF5_9SPHN|nr:YciI family protein [Sphingomonas sanxanigenens]AHE55800.1 hypothetical protein NX02_20795 [Sphingomonas sanxanigenens DSM 19645 = NX02]